jgi:hypothetical protein
MGLIPHRISDLETKIGAGLIEEVIQVAEGELKLVDTMVRAKVYVLLSMLILVPANYASQMGRFRGEAS